MSLMACLVVFALIAALYAAVGHGGASGYLALMALAAYPMAQMSTNALMLNVAVSGIASVLFWRAGHGCLRLLWPFAVTSVPAAIVGGWLPVSSTVYGWLLGIALAAAAVRLTVPVPPRAEACRTPSMAVALPLGAALGLLSGIVGVGGGIFLSPLMLVRRWADPKRTAAVSAVFILANSVAGLAGRLLAGRFEPGSMLPLAAVCIGGGAGAWLGAYALPRPAIRRLLAGVLAMAAWKLVLLHG